ncbi:MAG: class I SAM-dependent methyltransferase [Candidatus Tectomicrobia bacterium]|uniref:Class I SAM-dependent methyltransferase n=1 Tax=Tectimicrobiota bacterium TaxID=2528274 RepID=A0A932FVJ6_UNCTE|nr:class I SAM-dependent methyltransferase [Candidatus Tectomicrobia bacterium]
MIDERLTRLTKDRYDRQADRYDKRTGFMERMAMKRWRALLWEKVRGPCILEVGVGTGANLPFYPPGARVTAIDLSDRMLARAARRARKEGVAVELLQMDAQALQFLDHTFDTVVATCVFCSVPDPVLGLREIARVLQPTGRAVLLEHVRSETPLGILMDLLNPLVVRMAGANINRRTVENVRRAGLTVESVDSFLFNIVKLIVARPGKEGR